MLIFGTGLGIAIGRDHLDAVIVRSRARGPQILGATSIQDFRSRPAAEWGAELNRFLGGAHEKHLTATLLLPRDQVIVRTLNLPGVSDKDIPSAVELQIENLHPFGDEEVAWSFLRVNPAHILIGVVRNQVLSSYETLFSEAGIAISAITFSASAIHAALRIWSTAESPVLLFMPDERGRTEFYGESPARPLYSAEFSVQPERAVSIARAELRLEGDYAARALIDALPGPRARAAPALPWRMSPLLPAPQHW